MPLDLEVVTPERQLLQEQVDEVELPGKEGYMGILPGHAALLGQLGFGTLTYAVGSHRRYLAVHGGFLEVLNDHVRVLADAAERAEEIDLAKAREEERQAQIQVNSQTTGADPATALNALARAQARIATAEHKGT
jgi:F-type H+-transporting ATPase subunit epsilon